MCAVLSQAALGYDSTPQRVHSALAPALRLITRDLAGRDEVALALVAIGAPGGVGIIAMTPQDAHVPGNVLELAAAAGATGRVRIDSAELEGGTLGTIVSAPLRLPGGALGALCAELPGPPPAPGAAISWLIDSYARLASLSLSGDGFVGGLLASAHNDALTGCVNYPTLVLELTREVERCRRQDVELACCFCELIGHRQAARYGPAHGDRVLAEVGQALRQATRASDTVGRFGSHEFVVLSPGTGEREAAILAERIRLAVRELPVLGLVGGLDVFVGAAQWRPGVGPAGLIGAAEAALSQTKAETELLVR